MRGKKERRKKIPTIQSPVFYRLEKKIGKVDKLIAWKKTRE